MRRLNITLAFAIFANWAQAQYNYLDLGTLGGPSSQAYAINDSGKITGRTDIGGTSHAFIWDGTMHDLGALGSGVSEGYALNDVDTVAGRSVTSSGQTHAFSFDGTMHDLGTLGGNFSQGMGINNQDWVVGTASLPSGDDRAFLWDGSQMINLGTLGGSHSFGVAINDLDQVTGQSMTGQVINNSDVFSPFLWSKSSGMVDLGLLGSYTSGSGRAINNLGIVVGEYDDQVVNTDAFFWNGSLHALPKLQGARQAEAWGVNNLNQIVGYSQYSDGVWGGNVAVMWSTNGQISNLSPFLPGWSSSFATGINDVGQIVGFGVNASGQEHGFLLNPVPEPSTISILALGALALIRRRQ